ncbi:hypothetical protein AX769_00420 [Frondihabitans sp. PAMC 28766]|uniref:hypothetical protein n=1 Tax=Frondihabitans sp. PAMC 28766 TaxID=1795630 RepID=UPI00078E3079|nr:hypothetical protein [Frondihabitans sp. PAMC 28766]AMM18882.1 hypothetical protein AX769_00420 [Frondihabitans sp. PAMC 28766]
MQDDSLLPFSPSRPPVLRPSALDTRFTRALPDRCLRGELVRVHTGGYVAATDLTGLDRRQGHVLRVHAALPRLSPRVVVSHGSAAAIHRLPSLGPPPDRVHVTDPARTTSQAWNGVAKHAGPLPNEDVVMVEGVRVTSMARTAADLALALPMPDAVVVLDYVLHCELADRETIGVQLEARPRARARAAAAASLDFADGDAQSPGESWARVLAHRLGAPKPVLQRPFADADGVIGDVDFWFEEQGIVVEFDGFVKYSQARYLNGRTPADVVFAEKLREDRLRACPDVNGFGRCVWRDLEQPRRLASIFRRAGVPLLRPP